MATNLTNPYVNLFFRVEISGIAVAAFQQATLPGPAIGTVTYREGTDPGYLRPISGLTTYPNLTLAKGLTDSTDLYDWFQLVSQQGSAAKGAKKNVSLIQLDARGTDKCRWNIINAWPITYEVNGFDATSEAVVVETFTIAMDYMNRVK
jgi:phage tail-like protein